MRLLVPSRGIEGIKSEVELGDEVASGAEEMDSVVRKQVRRLIFVPSYDSNAILREMLGIGLKFKSFKAADDRRSSSLGTNFLYQG